MDRDKPKIWPKMLETQCSENELNKIFAELCDKGHYYRSGPVSKLFFESLIAKLGKVIRQEDIKLGVSDRGAHSSGPLGFHTDQAYVDLIAWHGIKTEPSGSPTLLVDSHDVLSHFAEDEIIKLSEILINCPIMDDGEVSWKGFKKYKFIEVGDNKKMNVFYMPWHVERIHDLKSKSLWEKFAKLVEEIHRLKPKDIELQENEFMVIDNHRMIHGRRALPNNSPRHLKRVWIQNENMRQSPVNIPRVKQFH